MPINPRPLSENGNIQFKVTTPPSGEPISVEEVKNFARISGVTDDEYLSQLIAAVRQVAEGYLSRALITQSITCYMDFWPSSAIELPRSPASSITAVRTRDEENVATTFDATGYFLISSVEPALLVIKSSATWPNNTSDRINMGYEIEYVAGYGAATAVPAGIKEGLMLWVAAAYENRVVSQEPPPSAIPVLSPYRMVRL